MTPIEYFYEIARIPHGSGNEKGIAEYIERIAREHGLFCIRDKLQNVYVRKPASAGMENKAPVLFAAHTDMVCEKLPSSSHDFLTDPIEIIDKNGLLAANGTTLGGDDGAGVAIMLSLMTDGALTAPVTEYLFTSGEETGMYGAAGFDYSSTVSDMIVNLDNGHEKSVCISCASGYHYNLNLPIERTRKSGKAVNISVCGLAGGHSGVEIASDKQNAIKMLGELLNELYSLYPFHIAELKCDGKANVIPPMASATVFFYNSDDEKQAKDAISEFEKAQRPLLKPEDAKKFRINYKKLKASESEDIPDALTLKSTSRVISALTLLPYGVLSRFPSDGTPESSVNFGILKTESDSVTVSGLARSASEFSDKKTRLMLERAAHMLGGELVLESSHDCWEYKRGTPLQDAYEKACKEIIGIAPEFTATHAGLECGTFCGRLKELGRAPDIISVGPNMYNIHTPKETLESASLIRVYNTLKVLLKDICQ